MGCDTTPRTIQCAKYMNNNQKNSVDKLVSGQKR